MDSDLWPPLPAHASKSRYDLYLGLEEMDCREDDDSGVEYPCPFCSEDFDMVGLCCHIDSEHPIEAKIGLCPVCQVRFGTDVVLHMIMEHGNPIKMQRKKRFRKGSSGTQSAISFLKKELREGSLQSFLGGSSYAVALSNAAPDPLLSSFISLSVDDSSKDEHCKHLDERSVVNKVSVNEVLESKEPSMCDKDHQERARRSEFVRELIFSTIFDDTL